MRSLKAAASLMTFAVFAFVVSATVSAQTPNTGSLLVVVVDQTGAVVKDASGSLMNPAAAAVREGTSGADGSVAFPSLSLTGRYLVVVSKAGFNEERTEVALRSGERATVRVKLLVGAEKAEVTVYGSENGVRA